MHGEWHTFDWPNLWSYWWLFMLFWWFGGMRLFAGLRRGLRSARREDPALLTLRDRFARGEIDRGEYEERRAVLRGRSVGATTTAQQEAGPTWPDLP